MTSSDSYYLCAIVCHVILLMQLISILQILKQESGAFALRTTKDSVSYFIQQVDLWVCLCYICHLV